MLSITLGKIVRHAPACGIINILFDMVCLGLLTLCPLMRISSKSVEFSKFSYRRNLAVSALFLHSKHQKSYQGILGTQEPHLTGSMTSPSLGLTGSFKRTLWFSRFWKAVFTFSRKLHSLNPLNIMEHVYGHCCTSPRFREPSWTFMEPQMETKMDPARLILGDPCR